MLSENVPLSHSYSCFAICGGCFNGCYFLFVLKCMGAIFTILSYFKHEIISHILVVVTHTAMFPLLGILSPRS